MEQGSCVHALRYRGQTRFYDAVAGSTSKKERFERRLVEQVGIGAGDRVLDPVCGTGTLTLAIARAAPAVRVVGLDGDGEALVLARRRLERAGAQVELVENLAWEAPFAPGSFDRVLSSFVFHHLTNDSERLTLRRLREWLRPNGELHIADGARPQGPLMRAAFLSVQLLRRLASLQPRSSGSATRSMSRRSKGKPVHARSEGRETEPSDETLMARYADGDPMAFATLFSRYERRVFVFFRRRTGSSERAQDLYQELFLRIHRAREGFDPNGLFAPWLFQIAQRLLIDDRRRAYRSREIALADHEPAAQAPSGEQGLAQREALGHALASLSSEEQQFVIGAKLIGIDYAELAVARGKSVEAVRQIVSRALRRLRAEGLRRSSVAVFPGRSLAGES